MVLKHIAFFSTESPLEVGRGGGIAAYLRALIPALIQTGCRVTVIAGAQQTGIQYGYQGRLKAVHVLLPSFHWYLTKVPLLAKTVVLPFRQIEWSWALYQAAQRVFSTDPVDLIETAESGAQFLTSNLSIPIITRLHGSNYVFRKYTGEYLHLSSRLNHSLEKQVWKQATAITSPSCFQAGEVAQEMNWPASRIHVIPNPIAPAILEASDNQNDLRSKEDASSFTVLYVGRLASVKGVIPLLKAAAHLQPQRRIRFVLIGAWQMQEPPQNWGLVQNQQLSQSNILWLGHLPWTQLVEWYRRSDMLVIPSYYETFGISALEAMAFQLPIVATRTGGLPEVVEDGVTGRLVPPGDAEALAAAITELAGDPSLRRQMGEAGRKRVLTHYRPEQIAEETLRLYEKII